MQVGLFDFDEAPPPVRARGLVSTARDTLGRFRTAREAGRSAADACLRAAEDRDGFDTKAAADHILAELHANGPTSGEILTDSAKRAGHTPSDDRAFGAVYQRLVRAGLIRCVGFCPRLKGHSTAGGRVWAAVL